MYNKFISYIIKKIKALQQLKILHMNHPIPTIEFELHYYLQNEHSHVMNAKIHNESERYLLLAIGELQKYLGYEIGIEVLAKSEGGLIDRFKIIVKNPIVLSLLSSLFTGLVMTFFRPAIPKTEEIKNKLEIIEKIKSGEYSDTEIAYIIQGDEELSKLCSLYYKSISQETEVTQIETTIKNQNSLIKQDKTLIKKSDFSGHIIAQTKYSTTNSVQATIYIVSPVLVAGRKLYWKGIYINQQIDFKIEDKEFLKQVYNHEIKFGAGTSITCTLKIITKTITATSLSEEKVSKTYIVQDILRWNDDEHFQFETKKYKKIKEEKRQLHLFDDTE